MRFLRSFNESVNFSIIRDILLDLTDDGFKFDVKWMPIQFFKKEIASGKNYKPLDIVVTLSRSEFTKSDIKGTIDRLSGYMESEGYLIDDGFGGGRDLDGKIGQIKKFMTVTIRYEFSPLSLMKAKSKF